MLFVTVVGVEGLKIIESVLTEVSESHTLVQDRAARSFSSLVVYHRNGSRVVPICVGEEYRIGRAKPSEIVIHDPMISRRHLCFEVMNGEFWVEDLGSTNGTFVGGKRIERCRLRSGERVIFGSAVAVIHHLAPGQSRRDMVAIDALATTPDGDGPRLESKAWRTVRTEACRAAHTRLPVLISGETGSGKEVLATILHREGPRRKERFQCVNCAAIPGQLLERRFYGR